MWHLRASIAALLLGIAIGLVSTHGCAGEHGIDEPPRDSAPVESAESTEGEVGDEGYYSQSVAEFLGASRCPSFVAVCEDFEAGMPDPSSWTTVMTANTVIGVDEEQRARGNRALHITLPPEPSEAYLRNESFFPRADDVVWGRLFFFVADTGPDAFVQYNVVEATGTSQEDGNVKKLARFGGVAVRDRANAFDFDDWLFSFEQRPRPTGFDELAIREDGRPMERGVWRCMEFMFDGVASEARVFRDGVEVESARGESPLEGVEWSMPSFDGIHIGFAHEQQLDRGFDVWIDGIALDDERIGCSN